MNDEQFTRLITTVVICALLSFCFKLASDVGIARAEAAACIQEEE